MPSARAKAASNRITTRTGVSADELARLYRDAALFVLPSDEEGLGIVVLEAMASGLPVVSTRCGGPEMVVDEGATGYLVATGDAAALSQRMEQIITTPEHADALGRQARRVAETRYSIAACGAVFIDAYDRHLAAATPV